MNLPQPIKVLHIVSVEKQNYYLSNLFRHSDNSIVEYCVAAFSDDDTEFLRDIREKGITAVSLGRLSLKNAIPAMFRLKRAIWNLNPDILHGHLFWPGFATAFIGKILRKKVFITRHHSDAVYKIESTPKRRFYLIIEKAVNSLANVIIAPSREVRRILTEVENVPSNKVYLIPYGQDFARFNNLDTCAIKKIREEFNVGAATMIVCVARLYKFKGHKYLLEALAGLKHRDFKLILVGEGDYRSDIEEMAANLGLQERVVFAGWRNDTLEIIAAADLVAHPSLEDALSSALIESIMLEKPVVATDISGAADTLGEGKFGKLVPPADSISLKKAIDETLDNLQSAKESAIEGRKYLLDYMSSVKVANQYTRLYCECLKKNEATDQIQLQ